MRCWVPLLWMAVGCAEPGVPVGGSDEGGRGDAAAPADDEDDGGADAGGDDTAADTGPAGPRVGVVLVIGDGMGKEHVRGGGLLATGDAGGLGLLAAPYIGDVRTASLSGFTDSAAAATTLATGARTQNGRLGQGPDGAALETLLDVAAARGLATGVVTTDTVTGATPAAFLVHQPDRYATQAIAAEIAAGLPDVLLGGGAAVMADRVEEGVTTVRTAAELAAVDAPGGPLVGLFADHELPYRVDGRGDAPDLPTMVGAALDVLEADPEGFVLVVEAARIDHASHFNRAAAVHHETVELDETVAAILARAGAWSDRTLTLVVTADHECGGMTVTAGSPAGETPATSWRWFNHTNARVGVYAWGEAAASLAGADVDHRAVHAVLVGAVSGVPPEVPPADRLADGALTDLGDPVTVQTWASDRAPGRGQLDALRLTADAGGLWIGVDAVLDDDADAVVAWIDVDVGAGTGAGADLVLTDHAGDIDHLFATFQPDALPAGFGIDAVVASIQATQARRGDLPPRAGLRLVRPPEGNADNQFWMPSVVNPSFERVAGVRAVPGIATGDTSGEGLEVQVPWSSLFPEGLPAEGTTLGVAVTLTSDDGTAVSNQALPPWAADAAPAAGPLPLSHFAVLSVDGDGTPTGPAEIRP